MLTLATEMVTVVVIGSMLEANVKNITTKMEHMVIL